MLADENSSQLHGDGVIESTAYVPKLSEIDNTEKSVLHSERGGAPASAQSRDPSKPLFKITSSANRCG